MPCISLRFHANTAHATLEMLSNKNLCGDMVLQNRHMKKLGTTEKSSPSDVPTPMGLLQVWKTDVSFESTEGGGHHGGRRVHVHRVHVHRGVFDALVEMAKTCGLSAQL